MEKQSWRPLIVIEDDDVVIESEEAKKNEKNLTFVNLTMQEHKWMIMVNPTIHTYMCMMFMRMKLPLK